MERTHNLDLPYILPSQAQKHVTHNEALRALDAIVQLGVRGRGRGAPPDDPVEGERWIVGADPSAAWTAARPGNVAAFQDGAWTFLTPAAGWLAWVEGEGLLAHDGTQWTPAGAVSGDAPTRVDTFGVNASADADNRLAVAASASLFTHDGGAHRLKVNKAGPDETAAVLFQSNWSGRAEFGLAGDDDWRVKVSANGTTWREALHVDAATGAVRFPSGTHPGQLAPAPGGAGPPGAPDIVTGPPNLVTLAIGRDEIELAAGTVHLAAIFVDRPTDLVGGLVAQHVGAAPGARMRAGVFRLGAPDGEEWRPGPLAVDLGTLPADASGHRMFEAAGTRLAPGWYLMALGVDAPGARVRVARWLTPGLQHYAPSGSGGGSDLAMVGASAAMRIEGAGDAIANGWPVTWDRPAICTPSLSGGVGQIVVPRWRRW